MYAHPKAHQTGAGTGSGSGRLLEHGRCGGFSQKFAERGLGNLSPLLASSTLVRFFLPNLSKQGTHRYPGPASRPWTGPRGSPEKVAGSSQSGYPLSLSLSWFPTAGFSCPGLRCARLGSHVQIFTVEWKTVTMEGEQNKDVRKESISPKMGARQWVFLGFLSEIGL